MTIFHTLFGRSYSCYSSIFRDTILRLGGRYSGSANDTVRLGDWVSMDKYGADGDGDRNKPHDC
ncbi:MAG: hypothetical protein U5L96_15325 [Owenweeksia sp.]|nr:hypothetical protein [Owenweeksia sp.]